MNKISINTRDNSRFDAWVLPASNPLATIHILHGMAEHCLRYQSFAEFLHAEGYQVILHNHRGHGGREPLGHFADRDQAGIGGWELLMDDIARAQNAVCGDEPRILFGHSMGSFIAQGYAMRHGDTLKALILSGSNHQPGALVAAGKTVATLLRSVQGQRHLSGVMDTLSFGEFNRKFRPHRTAFDWLSRDDGQVDAYIQDPYCGHPVTLQLWIDLLSGLQELARSDNMKKIPATLPVYIFGGDKDPVGQMGKGLPLLHKHFAQTGHDRVTLRLYPDGRHEMLNEINARDVFTDVVNWLKEAVWKP
ncbi:alpha/beta fold hydrolase [Thalassolituus sp. LLYu03]|uniref:alpha/beta fold hydrolase n=1 Tax=Thalassolituus sp. LLYu03 TaxID=3421656 RepID=UPI003D2C41AA